MKKENLYAISNSGNGLSCEIIDNFDKWIKERTEGIKTECQPLFSEKIVDESSAENVYTIIRGEIAVPKLVKVVTQYDID